MRVALKYTCLSLAAASVSADGLSYDAAEAKKRPVKAVLDLLRNMKRTVTKEGKDEEDSYKKLSCWCKTNRKQKTASTEETTALITDLRQSVDELSSGVTLLGTEMTSLKGQVQTAEEALATAKALYEKDLLELNEALRSLQEDIQSARNAKVTLGAGVGEGPGEFLQVTKDKLSKAKDTIGLLTSKRTDIFDSDMIYDLHEKLDSIQDSLADPSSAGQALLQTGAAGSGAGDKVVGMLEQIEETLKKEEKKKEDEKTKAVDTYAELKKAKDAEIKASTEMVETKRTDKASKKDRMFREKVEIKDGEKLIEENKAFMGVLEKKCRAVDKDWEARSQARAEEVEAIDQAIDILDTDEAHQTFAKTYSFLQGSAEIHAISASVENIAAVVAESGSNTKQNQKVSLLVQLAAEVSQVKSGASLDAFTKVKKAIDDMVGYLKKEQQEDVDKRTWCTNEGNSLTRRLEAKTSEKDTISSKVLAMGGQLEAVGKEVTELVAEIKDVEEQAQAAKTNRDKEKQVFLTSSTDQKQSIDILKKALQTLKGFYRDRDLDLVQIKAHQVQHKADLSKQNKKAKKQAPEELDSFKKNAGGNHVMGLISQIVGETQAMLNEGTQNEENAKKNYEALVASSKESVRSMKAALANQEWDKSHVKQDLIEAEQGKDSAVAELASLVQEKAALDEDCAFLLKNFDVRKSARGDEIQALREAKATLSGSQAFVQEHSQQIQTRSNLRKAKAKEPKKARIDWVVAHQLSALAEETSVDMATTRSETKMLKTRRENQEKAALASSSDDGYWNMRPIITGCFHECGSDLDCMTLCQVCVERASCKNVLDNCGECKTKVQESKKKAKQTPDLHRDGGGIRLASERLKQEVLDLRLKANREKKKLGELEENLVKARRQADWSKAVRQQARKSQEQAEKHLMKKKGEDAAWRLKYAKKFKDLRQALASNTGKKQRLRQQIKKAETLIEHAKLHLQKAEEKKNEKSIKSAKQVLKKVQATRKFLEEKQKRMNQEADKQNSKIEGVKKDNRWMARGMGDETQKAIKVVEDAEHKVKIATKKEKLDLEAVKVKIADVHKVVKEVKRLNEEADDAEKQLAKVGVPKEEPAPKTALLNIGELTSSTESM
eukprot:TRINITY_DN342_c0_g1_i2.p1 TRINITY_DN342_c0_g1~~TRINITY_DN342_c0_g1_i2.p1  ORF type:complete len:1120 (-),score=353.37 TRINITY_DN342_c0_g1_i2:524-3883(-)